MAGYETAAEMEKVIERWLELIAKDQAVSDASKGYDVSVEFEIEDLDLFFYTHFHDGSFTGGLGQFPEEAMVELCMSSAVFDGMFGGELDATTAAMSGDLAFAGDISAAMGLQSMQDDLNRLYVRAKQETA
jgi:putative sterol carrier protein